MLFLSSISVQSFGAYHYISTSEMKVKYLDGQKSMYVEVQTFQHEGF